MKSLLKITIISSKVFLILLFVRNREVDRIRRHAIMKKISYSTGIEEDNAGLSPSYKRIDVMAASVK